MPYAIRTETEVVRLHNCSIACSVMPCSLLITYRGVLFSPPSPSEAVQACSQHTCTPLDLVHPLLPQLRLLAPVCCSTALTSFGALQAGCNNLCCHVGEIVVVCMLEQVCECVIISLLFAGRWYLCSRCMLVQAYTTLRNACLLSLPVEWCLREFVTSNFPDASVPTTFQMHNCSQRHTSRPDHGRKLYSPLPGYM